MKKYLCLITRYGFVTVEADSETEAMDIVNCNCKTDDIDWSDDWEATTAEEVEG